LHGIIYNMKKIIKNAILALMCGAVLLSASGCGQTAEVTGHKQFFCMDTVMTLEAYGDKGSAAVDTATGVITDLASELDPQSESSEVYKMNNAGGVPVTVSDDIITMLSTAYKVYGQTDGALDLTVYPLSVLWGFIDLDNGGAGYVPTQAEIAAVLKKVGFSKVTVSHSTVTMPEGTEISFGSVAKGYTSDAAIASMKNSGVTSAIVSLGGNVQTLGKKPDGTNWNVAVEDPKDTSSYAGVLSVGQTAVITSGSYERYFEKDGKIYHHIIDPHTGSPADSGLLSVTIVCDSGLMADCLSTALFVLGPEKALDYWRNYGGFQMIMITTDSKILCTSGLKDSFTLSNTAYTVTYED
jgi:thiamine biosynthesis lipoprotein